MFNILCVFYLSVRESGPQIAEKNREVKNLVEKDNREKTVHCPFSTRGVRNSRICRMLVAVDMKGKFIWNLNLLQNILYSKDERKRHFKTLSNRMHCTLYNNFMKYNASILSTRPKFKKKKCIWRYITLIRIVYYLENRDYCISLHVLYFQLMFPF